MKILIGILIINGFLTVPAFSQKIKFNTNDSLAVFDSNDIIRKRDDSVNYKGYIRVFDGLVMEQNKAVAQEIKVISILRLNDTIKLKKLGVKYWRKPYAFYNSSVTSFHQFVYDKIGNDIVDLQEINLPIILNGKLITPDQYYLLNKLDTANLTGIKYLPRNVVLKKYKDLTAVGAITVTMPIKLGASTKSN